jgi:hypothetical protein
VTINQGTGQKDPTVNSIVVFHAAFSKPVTDFTAADVSLNGTASGAAVSSVAPIGTDGTTYDIDVTGMAATGTIVATIPAGRVHDAAGNLNLASTSTDNSITYVQSQGAVAFLELPAQNASTGPLWYYFQTARAGLVTVDGIAAGLPASASLTLYDAAGNQLSTSTMFGGNQRLMRTAAAGENYFVKLTATATSVKVRIANLVVASGSAVTVFGTSGADAFTLRLRQR